MLTFATDEQPGLLPHGGRLQAAAAQFSIPLADWLDLSTGINPNGWPILEPPVSVWRRLPEDDDGLDAVACRYYGVPHLLPVAGSQAAIQALPRLRRDARVSVLHPGFSEHAHAWRSNGHRVTQVAIDQIDAILPDTDVLLVTQPNNPTGALFPLEKLLHWHKQLTSRGGWLIVDEAYMDATPENSVTAYADQLGLIVLRSLGKFFGLAGARVGFVCAEPSLLQALRQLLGPWTINRPARWMAVQALCDTAWQQQARVQLLLSGHRLQTLLTQNRLVPAGGCAFFQWVISPHAVEICRALATQGILVRYFSEPLSLRFGLPASESDWLRLGHALAKIPSNLIPA